MQLVKVAAAALNQTPLDWEGNKRNILAAVTEARKIGASILCLPELCITGYGCEDAFLAPGVRKLALDVLAEVAPQTRGMIVSLGLPLFFNNGIFNASCLLADGQPLGFVCKQNLAGDGIHYEPRWFKPWPNNQRARVTLGARELPLGDVYFDCGGIKIGFEICEDAWIAQRPGAELALDAVDVILNPSASHFAFGKHEIRRRLVLEGSRAFGTSYVYANLLGNEAGRALYDGDSLIATNGQVIAESQRFSFKDHTLISATVDIDLTRTRRGWLSSYQPHVMEELGQCVHTPFVYPDVEPEKAVSLAEQWDDPRYFKEEEFTRAISLGLYDYMRKSRSRGMVVSMSGGADSAAVAVLGALMVGFGAADVGLPALLSRLDYVPGLAELDDERAVVGQLLTTVYQATRNSSDVTRNAARRVAEALGSRHLELDVDPMVESYVEMIGKALGRSLSWEHDDIALQNIQARARAPGVWMLANLNGALLLSTSNRSEAAVGYATMDGDTAGGLSPIAGIDKAFLRRWLRWMEKSGPSGQHPIPAIQAVTCQQPTAELRPLEQNQTDEADLMPYELLDAIERAAIRDKRTPVEVYRLMRVDFAQYTPAELLTWVERFFVLWSRNQWKRERYAPSFHVDDANLDPKTWCRWPILSGSFQRELGELHAYVKQHA